MVTHPPDKGVRIQEEMQWRLLPAFHFLWRERQKEFRTHRDLSLPRSGFPLTRLVFNRDQSDNRLFPACDYDFFAPTGPLNESRKLGFSLMDGDRFHRNILANLTWLLFR